MKKETKKPKGGHFGNGISPKKRSLANTRKHRGVA
jgi:hypothetical protein